MNIDFPDSPAINDEFTAGDRTWQWTGTAWEAVLNIVEGPTGPVGPVGNLDTLGQILDVSFTDLAAEDNIVYDGENWVNQKLSYDIDDLTSLNSADALTAPNYYIDVDSTKNANSTLINFSSDQGLIVLDVSDVVNISGSNYVAGALFTVKLENNTLLNYALNFPAAWRFVGIVPTEIASNKIGILSITCFGNQESDVVAAYIEEL